MTATPALSLSIQTARRHGTALVLRPRYTPVPAARAAVPVAMDEVTLLLARASKKDAARLLGELGRTGRRSLPTDWPRQAGFRLPLQVPTLRELGR